MSALLLLFAVVASSRVQAVSALSLTMRRSASEKSAGACHPDGMGLSCEVIQMSLTMMPLASMARRAYCAALASAVVAKVVLSERTTRAVALLS